MKKLIFWGLSLMMPSMCVGQAPLYHFDFDNDPTLIQTVESVSNTSIDIANQFNRPERGVGVSGEAIRLDGYSTWVSSPNFSVSGPTERLSLECWFAPECFNEQRAGLISQVGSQGGFALNVDPYGEVVFEFFANNSRSQLKSTRKLNRYEWNHIVAQVDLDTDRAWLWVNGEKWEDVSYAADRSSLTIPSIPLFLGRRNATTNSPNGFPTMVANGLMDEVRIFGDTLSAATILSRYQAGSNLTPDLSINPYERFTGDHLRPHYHAMPDVLWANEGYGFTYYDSLYHYFYQKNPNHADLYFMHWGHLVSPDLAHWEEVEIALAPQEGFSDFGIWSGTTTFDSTGKPVISYTGVNGQFAGIGMAFPQDDSLINWNTYQNGTPVIARAPSSFNNLDFRDPYIWKEGNVYYMIVGSGVANDQGGILATYTSTDLINWTETLPLYRNNDIFSSGIFWEMPTFFPIKEDIWALVVTPVYKSGPAQCLYWIGTWDGGAFTPFNESPQRFESLTRHFLAPAFGLDEAGRWAYMGIIPEDRDVNDQIAAGWRQVFSLPRVARLLNDTLIGHYPHPNLCRLRTNPVSVSNRTIQANTTGNLAGFSGNQTEVEAVFVPGQTDTEFVLRLLQNPAGGIYTDIGFNLRLGRLGIDRRNSSPFPTREDNRFAFYEFNDTIRVRAFIDHSVLEVFVDNLAVLSARVYPSEDALGMDVIVDAGSVEISTLTAWDLVDKETPMLPDTACPPTFLPNGFGDFTTTHDFETSSFAGQGIRMYPNPSRGQISVHPEGVHAGAQLSLTVFDIQGEQLLTQLSQGATTLDLRSYGPGLYVVLVQHGSQQVWQKVMIR